MRVVEVVGRQLLRFVAEDVGTSEKHEQLLTVSLSVSKPESVLLACRELVLVFAVM